MLKGGQGNVLRCSSSRNVKTGWRRGFTLLFAILLCAGAGVGQAIDESELKAVFLYNCAKFVEWPPEAFSGPKEPIVSCILGNTPIGAALAQAAGGKLIGDRRLVVRHISDLRETSGCQIVFVSSSERQRLRSILGEIKTSGILTVGDTEEFNAEGGVVNFKLEAGRIRIQVNLEAAELARLRISSRLLSLAQIVKR